MMRSVRLVAVLAIVLVASACGGKGPTAPTEWWNVDKVVPTTPTPSPTPVPLPSSFNFLVLGPESVGLDPSELQIWGLRGENTATFVGQMVFADNSTEVMNAGLRPMYRVSGEPIELYVPDSFSNDMGLFEQAAVEFGRLGVSMTITRTPPPPSSPTSFFAEKRVGFSGPACERAWNSSGVIYHGGLIFPPDYPVKMEATIHELGHLFGLNHHFGTGVDGFGNTSNVINFSQIEVDNARFMLRLAPKTTFPAGSSITSSLSAVRPGREIIQ